MEKQFDTSKASQQELESMAYKTLVQIELLQKNLQILNQAIQKKSQEKPQEPIMDEKIKKFAKEIERNRKEEDLKFVGH